MDQTLIPPSARWLAPILEHWLEHYPDDDVEIPVDLATDELIRAKLTFSVREDIELWLDESDSDTASDTAKEFLMGMIMLDELGFLEATEPELNYESWRADLRSKNWGKVRAAAREIGDEYLQSLPPVERDALKSEVEDILESKSFRTLNSHVWLVWLRCLIEGDRQADRQFLRQVIRQSSTDEGEQFDVICDACSALLSLPRSDSLDVETVIDFIFSEDTAPENGAIALEYLLNSSILDETSRHSVISKVRASPHQELHEVIDECGGEGLESG